MPRLPKKEDKDFCSITFTCSSSVEEFKALKRLLEIEKALANKDDQPSMVEKNRMPKKISFSPFFIFYKNNK